MPSVSDLITIELLQRVMPTLKSRLSVAARNVDPLATACERFEINTPARIAAFLAQCAHESGELKYFSEIWGPTPQQRKYDPPGDLAKALGNIESGDGFRFRGRGPIQLTGRANYKTFGDLLKLDLVGEPEQVSSSAVGWLVAALFWQRKGLNEIADTVDRESFERITKRINGGLNGYSQRLLYWERAKVALGITQPSDK